MNKRNLYTGLALGCLVLIIAACGSAPAATSTGGGGGSSSASRGRPAWVDSVDSVYDKSQYVAAVGTGNDRPTAENSAFGNLISIFGQSIKVDQNISSLYQDAVNSGVMTSWSENTTMQNTISTSASMDRLVGAEIKEVWTDSKTNTVYAAAVMDKAQAAKLYSDMIKSNIAMINNLTSMSQAEKNTLEGYSRYQFAAAVADMNISYESVLKVIGAAVPGGVKKGDDYRLEAVEITKTIPIAVTVRGDRQGRIQAAIAKVLTDLGFRSGGSNSRYVVNAALTISDAGIDNPNFIFANFEITADLIDTSIGQTLVPFSVNGREGGRTLAQAESTALRKSEDAVSDEFTYLLKDYLSRMMPKK
jgi:hypothetical protein